MFFCKHCMAVCETQKDLSAHLNNHVDERPFVLQYRRLPQAPRQRLRVYDSTRRLMPRWSGCASLTAAPRRSRVCWTTSSYNGTAYVTPILLPSRLLPQSELSYANDGASYDCYPGKTYLVKPQTSISDRGQKRQDAVGPQMARYEQHYKPSSPF